MVRPVWHFPRHSEADTSETLQSDVMRFMAILALCLIAIFALVQSLPLRPLPGPEAAQPAAETPPPVPPTATVQPSPIAVEESVTKDSEIKQTPFPAQEAREETSTPAPPQPPVEAAPAVAPKTVRPGAPAPERKPESRATPAEAPQEASMSAGQEGLILRFVSGGVLRFAPATAPRHFYSMTPDTVPSAIAHALEDSAPTARDDSVTWGVTLPADTQLQLERLIEQHRSGALIIDTSGRVRFQQAG
jgi:type IV secretory pathway VirB10-like protein